MEESPHTDLETLLWCVRPQLDLHHLQRPLSAEILAKPLTSRVAKLPELQRFGQNLVVTETQNQWLAVSRMLPDMATPLTARHPSPEERATLLTAESVVEACRRIDAGLRAQDAGAVSGAMTVQLQKVALAIAAFRSVDFTGIDLVIVATQHSPFIRALIRVSAERGVPVLYVPHAPVANNNAYRDLPTQYAAVRGPGEQDYYASEVGAARERIDVVGNLSSDALTHALPTIAAEKPGVLALSPHPETTLAKIFAAVTHVGTGPMLVAPHPRSDVELITRLMPAGWKLHSGRRTFSLLAEGPPFMMQYSSGVAWEGAVLGIPTATIRLDETSVNYPLLEDTQIFPEVRVGADAATFAERARAGRIDRDRLRANAEYWCSADGDRAAAALSALVERARERPSPGTLIHDGWGPGGGAIARSWLRGTDLQPVAE